MWLTTSLAEWYTDAVFSGAKDLGPIGIIAKVSAIALVAGVVLALVRRQRSLFWFLMPVGAAHIFVAVAGVYERTLAYPSNASVAAVPFLIGELAACICLVFRSRGARTEAVLLTVFTLGYSWFAAFIAAMALTGDWL